MKDEERVKEIIDIFNKESPELYNKYKNILDKPKVKWIPSIGDWVLVDNYTDKYNGKIVKITKIAGNYCYFEPCESDSHNFNKDKIVRKAEEHEIPKVMKKEQPKIGEFWIFTRGATRSKLCSEDSIYEVIDHGRIQHVWNGNKLTGQNVISYTITHDLWRKTTPQDLIDAGITSKEPELIEGQWYEWEQTSGCGNWLVELESHKNGYIKHKRCVYLNGGQIYNNSGWGTDNLIVKGSIKLADKETIYKYFPEERPKEKVMDNWCYKVTEDSKKAVKEWLVRGGRTQMSVNVNAYYGLRDGEISYGSWSTTWGKILTTEEFYKKIGHIEEKPMNTYGLKVGDVLPFKILDEWCKKGQNWSTSYETWQVKSTSPWYNDRTIVSFGERYGVIGFAPSGCSNDLHLRAEGFKEFMDNFNKPKLEKGKYYSWKGADGTRYMQFVEKIDETTKTSYYRWEKEGKNQNEHLNGTDIYPLKDSIFKEVTEQEAKGTKTSELTSLPEKWCIKITNENRDTLSTWRSDGRLSSTNDGFIYHPSYKGMNKRGYCEQTNEFNLPQLTFEQFKKWVLKEPIKEQVMENLTGRWLKALRDNPEHIGSMSAGQYIQIKQWGERKGSYDLGPTPNGSTGWVYSTHEIGKVWELMPIGWTPETENKKYCVNVRTQEQWDFVTSKIGHKWTNGKFESYKENTVIYLKETTYGNIHGKEGQYYSFEEWCTKFGHIFTPEQEWKIGDWAYVTKDFFGGYKKTGDVFQVIEVLRSGILNYLYFTPGSSVTSNRIRKALPHEIPRQSVFPVEKLEAQRTAVIITDIFKPKKSVKMSYFTEELQKPRTLGKINKNKHLTI